jgi:hypothetical protein
MDIIALFRGFFAYTDFFIFLLIPKLLRGEMTMLNSITFKDIADCMGMDEARCTISLSLPPVREEVMKYRVFCIADMIIKRLIQSGELKKWTGNTWAEVKEVQLISDKNFVAMIQFNGSPQRYPLEFSMSCLLGYKDSLVQQVRKVEREMPDKLKTWVKVTKNGLLSLNSLDLLRKINRPKSRKVS